jgi:putative membrane protein
MKTGNRILAGFLAAAVLIPSSAATARAAAPSVTTDESMYVNLDHYGKVDQVNVVKRVNLNGNSKFTDYGSYEKVTNMTNLAEPNVSAQGVSWNLPENTGNFFYECTLKPEAASLPWSFDVSYKLNGVPADAGRLAGAAGTVEIGIKAVPNKKAGAYFKNNMLLQAGALIDMEDTLSVEAPGAQLQTVGKSKLVLFAALPGEETTFTMRIGTKKFETDGLVMMMVPGTLDQMKDIKDLKKDKDTVKDSVDAIHDSTNMILSTIESTSAGLRRAQSGLVSLDRARGTVSAAKDGLYDKADLSLADLSAAAQQTASLVPHLQSAQQMVGDVNGDMNALTKAAEGTKPSLNALDGSIGEIQSDAANLRDVLKDIENASDDRESLRDDMKDNIKRARKIVRDTKDDIGSAQDDLDDLKKRLSSLKDSMNDLNDSLGNLQDSLQKLAAGTAAAGGTPDPKTLVEIELLKKARAVLTSTQDMVSTLGTVCGNADDYLDTADEIASQADDTADLADDMADLGDVYFDALENGAHAGNSLLKHSSELGSSAQKLLRQGQTIIDRASALNGTMNRYKPETVAALKDTEELTRRLTNALNSSNAFLSSFESTMKDSDGNLDAGTRDSLSGMIDVLGRSLDGIAQTATVKKANDAVKGAVDREMDKYEDDSNLLNLDAEAKPVSFTSAKNPPPGSIQIVLRTEEISVESKEESTENLEKEKEKAGPFQRMVQVFQKIWQAVADAFRE